FFYVVRTHRPQTRFAPGFTERGFASISVGATADEVLRLVGPPLKKKEMSDGTTVCYYSEGLSKDFEHRALALDKSGRVVEKTAAVAPSGVQRPKTIAAISMNPCPAGMRASNWPRMPTDSAAPPSPANAPLQRTQAARSGSTRTPAAAAAWGFSPTARMRRP